MADARFPSVRALILDLDGTLIDSKLDLIHSVNAMLREAYPGVQETLAQLSHMPMAVLTNKPERISVRILNSLGLARYFRTIYGGNSFESKKPDPFGANKILQEFGIAAREALLVGDSEVDVQTARNAGTQAAAVNYGFGVHDRAAHPADIYLDSFADLAEVVRNHTAA
jgi:HAD superfamily hydrolase (TIGR01509 family)